MTKGSDPMIATDGAIEHIGSVVTRDGFYVWHFYRKY